MLALLSTFIDILLTTYTWIIAVDLLALFFSSVKLAISRLHLESTVVPFSCSFCLLFDKCHSCRWFKVIVVVNTSYLRTSNRRLVQSAVRTGIPGESVSIKEHSESAVFTVM